MRRPGTDLSIESETQWKVTWFPPDRNEVVRTGTETQVLKMAILQAEWNPIIEKREIVVGAWETVDPNAKPEEASDGDEG